MLKPVPTEPPRFYGITTFSDHADRFKFWVPSTWKQFELDDGRDGIMFVPDPDDLDTHISCWVEKLEQAIKEEDREELRAGVEEGLKQLPDCEVESRSDDSYGNMIKFERIFTYGEAGDVRRKRRSWFLYADEWAIVLSWQGATPEHYEHWLPMGNYAFATFDVAEWLWFATDRDLGFRP